MSYPTLPTNFPPATPQKPLPGAYMQTPAVARNESVFRSPAAAPQPVSSQTPMPKLPPAASKTQSQTLSTEERGARTINDTLFHESRYPDLDSYLSREFGLSSDLCIADTALQRASLPNTTFPHRSHGRRFKKSKCTIFPIRSSISTIAHKFRRAWVYLPS